jgi:activator of HSP90 ATPase
MMSERKNPSAPSNTATRRQMMAGVAIAFGSLAAGYNIFGKSRQHTMSEKPGASANQARTSLHQETDLTVSPQRIYALLLDSTQFAACTGRPAEIDSKAGGAFSMFGGLILGRNVELIPSQRIVQAWRPSHWDPGVYSIVKFELKSRGSGTTVVLDHTGFPEGDFDRLSSGWNEHYWEPLKKFLA